MKRIWVVGTHSDYIMAQIFKTRCVMTLAPISLDVSVDVTQLVMTTALPKALEINAVIPII